MPKVTDPALLQELNGGGQQQPTQQGRAYPGIIQGAPAPVDPMEERRDQQDITKGDLDIQAKRLDIEKRQAEMAERELSTKLGKEAGFYLRAATAGPAFEKLMIGPEGQFRASVSGIVPDNWMNQMTSEERQVAEAYMRDFAMASLRYESGAAIPPEEIKSQIQTFFPVAGDKPDTIEAKAQLRRNLIQSLRLGAGAEAASEVDAYLETLKTEPTQATGGTEERDETPSFEGEEVGLGAGERISYEGETFEQKQARLMAEKANELSGQPGAMLLAKQGMSLGLLDEASGVGNAIGSLLRGDTNVGENYRIGRDAERMRLDQARENAGWTGTAAEVIGGGAGIIGKAGQVMSAARSAKAAGQPITRANVQGQMARQAGRDGAGVGALGGYGYGEGLEGSTVNALGGAVLGGGIGYGAQKAGNALANRAGRRDASELAEAGRAEGVTVNRAMADPNSNNAVTKADASLIGGRRVQREMEAVEGQLEEGVERLGRGGQALDQTATGDRVQRAGERVIEETREVTTRKYQAAERMAGDTKIRPARARSATQTMIRDLSETANANATEINFLKGLAEDFQKPLTIGALRDLRTALRKKISRGDLVFGQNEARVMQIMDEAAQDISEGLRQAGKAQAASAFDAADTAYAARMDLIEGTVQKLIGRRGQNLSAEQVARKFESMAKSDAQGLRKFWSQLDPSERADMQATFASALGRNRKGEFSPAIFLNNIGGKNPVMSERAIRIVFGRDGAESVRNLEKLATEINRVTGAMNSRSSKSGVASYRDWLWSGLATGGGAFGGGLTEAAMAGAAVAGATATKQVLSARALMSPKIQKWLLSAPKTQSPRAIDAHFNRLGDIAKAEPALAGEIETLRKAILGAANDNAGSLAAEEQNAEEGQ